MAGWRRASQEVGAQSGEEAAVRAPPAPAVEERQRRHAEAPRHEGAGTQTGGRGPDAAAAASCRRACYAAATMVIERGCRHVPPRAACVFASTASMARRLLHSALESVNRQIWKKQARKCR